MKFQSQTPLGERVPSAILVFKHGEWFRRVSNPSRGTCAFGRILKALNAALSEASQTPLGERVPSAILAR